MPEESSDLSIFAATASAHCKDFAKYFLKMRPETAEFMLVVIQSLKLFVWCGDLGCADLKKNN